MALIRFALTSGARIESEQALDWVQEVEIVVHCNRPRSPHDEGRNFQPRQIDEIAEVAGAEGNRATLNPLFQGAGPDLRWLGVRPRFAHDLAAGKRPTQPVPQRARRRLRCVKIRPRWRSLEEHLCSQTCPRFRDREHSY